MAGPLNDDKRVLEKGRKSKRSQDYDVEVGLRDRNIRNLVKKLEDKEIGRDIVRVWTAGNADRSEWLDRQEAYLEKYDEFIDPIYEASMDWSSTLHLPVTFIVAKTYHARMYSALMNVDPPFTVRARHSGRSDQAPLVQDLMRYVIKDWANEYQGIEEVIDRWIWDWCIAGVGILKARWHKKYSKFIDVQQVAEDRQEFVFNEETGLSEPQTVTDVKEVESETFLECFNGPMIDRVQPEDLLIVGGDGDPQKADFVGQQEYLTASELWSMVDQGIFDKDAVEEVIRAGEDMVGSEVNNSVKARRSENAGEATLDKEYDKQRYQIIEAYVRYDLDGTGIDQDLIVWVHKATGRILRATYLFRAMPTGMRPFFKIDFHKRNNATYGIGLVELLFSLNKEMDAMHNIRVDTGILTSMPWGFYKPTSSMSEEKLPIEPGALIPLDSPQTDVFFPNLGNRTSFGLQEEQGLNSYIERLTSVSDLTLGIVGGQGATRTATGTRALVGETNANLDIYLRRLNRGFTGLLKYLFALLQVKLPSNFQFRILGDDGNNYWAQIDSPQQLAGMYDFELDANSANSNPMVQRDVAAQTVQMVMNPLLIQLGIVRPLNIYEAMKSQLQAMGVKDVSKYITKPREMRLYTPEECVQKTLAGVNVPLGPEQDLTGIINYIQTILDRDDLLGTLTEEQTVAIYAKMQEATQMQQALEQQAAQAANFQQVSANSQLGTQATMGSATPGPAAGPQNTGMSAEQ